MRIINHLILGIQFLTRIPLTQKPVPCEPKDFKGAIRFFSVIGLIVGFIQYIVFQGMSYLVPGDFAAFLAALAGVVVTGGIHLDGLSDIFDGFGANASRERTFEIMKDSRVGAFGALAIVMDLMFHIIGFQMLQDQPIVVIMVPVFAKLSVALLCRVGKNAKAGLGALWIENIDNAGMWLNGATAIVVGILLVGVIPTFVLVSVVIGVTFYLRRYFTQKLGGITGDCLGATNQLLEWVILTCLIIGV
ncbi:MAG: adenosylcobinamide-GDP ribazoletransferase [Cellulosilyticaceae bacterium]